MNNKDYIYLKEKGVKVKVSEIVYKEYWKYTEKEKYFEKCEKRKISTEDIVLDSGFNLEEHIIRKIMVDKLNIALSKLSDEEYKIITDIFFYSKTERELSKELNYTRDKIKYLKFKILNKLKIDFKDF